MRNFLQPDFWRTDSSPVTSVRRAVIPFSREFRVPIREQQYANGTHDNYDPAGEGSSFERFGCGYCP
jgi:hypothetical protein